MSSCKDRWQARSRWTELRLQRAPKSAIKSSKLILAVIDHGRAGGWASARRAVGRSLTCRQPADSLSGLSSQAYTRASSSAKLGQLLQLASLICSRPSPLWTALELPGLPARPEDADSCAISRHPAESRLRLNFRGGATFFARSLATNSPAALLAGQHAHLSGCRFGLQN